MENDKKYRGAFESGLKNYLDKKSPENLYEPIQYILNLGGKRIRPLLVLMSADLFGANSIGITFFLDLLRLVLTKQIEIRLF